MRRLTLCAIFLADPSVAQHQDALRPSSDLAAVLASEEYCEFRYDQTQVERYIVLHPDLGEPGSRERLAAMVRDQASMFDNHSASQKIAHCGWIRTIGEEGGFLK
ncbi:hypothetical protein [Roseitranquillus sediminis]|uniref:hypothetical protein n=1 Tax=Roseitranquillus sediminis TaxID=2809051 RepID=UPI001D0C1B03|nr:hypothetical protein [Roseitranquillus sediminis]MBM9593025.1 hypothetical protein [Roseitranquillus sediminis]